MDGEATRKIHAVKRPPFDDMSEDNPKRFKPAVPGYDRIVKGYEREPIPVYDIKRSRVVPSQERGIYWLTTAGKERFENKRAVLLDKWGVKRAHTGTCVLCPEDWNPLKPTRIMELFNNERCPPAGSARLTYQYSDHQVKFARAAAWFEDRTWPRRGVDLDIFLGDGPYKPMDASHLCHHDDCIIHITYEPANVNQDRKRCRLRAQQMRQRGENVPEKCGEHNPPCLMQVSVPFILGRPC